MIRIRRWTTSRDYPGTSTRVCASRAGAVLVGLALTTLVSVGCSGSGGGSASLGGGGSTGSIMVTDTDAVVVVGSEGGPFKDGRRTYEIVNLSNVLTARWYGEASEPWLVFSEIGGLLGPGASTNVTVSVDGNLCSQLPPGDYPADVIIRDARNTDGDVYLAFILRILPLAGGIPLTVTPEEEIEVAGTVGEPLDPDSIMYTLTNVGEGPVAWTAESLASWMQVADPCSGELPAGASAEVTVGLDASQLWGLGAGTYEGGLVFTAQLDGDPLEIARTVTVLMSPEDDSDSDSGRVTDGLLALYDFEQTGSTVVRDVSGVGSPLDLAIEDPSATCWVPGALRIEQPTRLASSTTASKVISGCKSNGELTVEAWIDPANLIQDGPARIFTLSQGGYDRNVTLGQGLWGGQPSDTFDVRLRTTATDDNGMPSLSGPSGAALPGLQHVVYTRDPSGAASIYVNSVAVVGGSVAGNLSNWENSFALTLANESGASRPWLGTLHLVAVYDRALSSGEVEQNFAAGTGDEEVGYILVEPTSDFIVNGIVGSSFSEESKAYTLENPGPDAVQWSITSSESWVYVTDSTAGELLAGEEIPFELHLDAASVLNFAPGVYEADIAIVNHTNGLGNTELGVKLTISEEDDDDGGGDWDGDKPGPHNTGPYDESLLVPSGSIKVTQDGAVIENVHVSGGIYVEANNVTIRNFRIDGGFSTLYGVKCTYGKTGIVIEDGEITRCASAGMYGTGFTARRLEIHEMAQDAIKCRGDNVVEGCWIHHLGLDPNAHADGNQTRKGSNILLRGNFFDMPKGISGGYKSNATSINQAELGDIHNLVMDGNWLNGGNFTVYFTAKNKYGQHEMRDCKLINNRFGRDYAYGVLKKDGNVINFVCYGNVWDDTGGDMDINH